MALPKFLEFNKGKVVGRKECFMKLVQSLVEVSCSRCLVASLTLKGLVALPKMDPLQNH